MLFILRVLWATLILFLPFLIGCTSPLWWHNPQRSFIYKGVLVVITDQATVMEKCGSLYLGCVLQRGVAYSVNNQVALAHECRHIDALTSDSSFQIENITDLLGIIFPIEEIAITLTGFISATDCGDGTLAVHIQGKWTINSDQQTSKWKMLPKKR